MRRLRIDLQTAASTSPGLYPSHVSLCRLAASQTEAGARAPHSGAGRQAQAVHQADKLGLIHVQGVFSVQNPKTKNKAGSCIRSTPFCAFAY